MAFKHSRRVYNVIPGDFTQDGRLDLLVYSQSTRSGEVAIDLYAASPSGGFGEDTAARSAVRRTELWVDLTPITAPPSVSAQPMPMDVNGDLKIDLFGITSPPTSSSPFKVWQNVWNASSSQSDLFSTCVVHRARVYTNVNECCFPTEWTRTSAARNARSPTLTAMLQWISTGIVLPVRTFSIFD